MARELTARERELIVFLLENAEGIDEPISAEQRATWLARVPQLRVGGVCGCGTCPSTDLVTAERPRAAQTRDEVFSEFPTVADVRI